MKTGNAEGVDGRLMEMVKANGLVGIKWLTILFYCVMEISQQSGEDERFCRYRMANP